MREETHKDLFWNLECVRMLLILTVLSSLLCGIETVTIMTGAMMMREELNVCKLCMSWKSTRHAASSKKRQEIMPDIKLMHTKFSGLTRFIFWGQVYNKVGLFVGLSYVRYIHSTKLRVTTTTTTNRPILHPCNLPGWL